MKKLYFEIMGFGDTVNNYDDYVIVNYKYMKVYQRQLLFVCGINNHVLFSIRPI